MELPTSSLYLAVPIVVAGLATLWAIWPEKYVGWLQAMKQKLKMTPAMRDLLDTDQKTANSAEKFEGIAVNQSIQQLMRDTCRKRLEQEHPEFDEKTVGPDRGRDGPDAAAHHRRLPEAIEATLPPTRRSHNGQQHYAIYADASSAASGKCARREDAPSRGSANAGSCHVDRR
jgi:hypothetical protein